jgi:preprotein translocase subunit SecF
VQEFGSPQDVLVRFENKTQTQNAQQKVIARVAKALPGVQIQRIEVVGATVSSELFRNGMLATGLALVAILVYIWFRFEWEFGVGVVATPILDATKTIGFFAVTQIQFDFNSVAALLTLRCWRRCCLVSRRRGGEARCAAVLQLAGAAG